VDNPFDEYLVVQSDETARDQASGSGAALPYAITSLIVAALWIYGFGSLFGIGFGAIALLELGQGANGGRAARVLSILGIALGILGLGFAVWVARDLLM
jgi:NADH:ubiquinone oxidoreductase subunit 2 (subunit N)